MAAFSPRIGGGRAIFYRGQLDRFIAQTFALFCLFWDIERKIKSKLQPEQNKQLRSINTNQIHYTFKDYTRFPVCSFVPLHPGYTIAKGQLLIATNK